MNILNFEELYMQACVAGTNAVNAMQVTPMVVSGHGRQYYVEDGACGFAWVVIKPANSAFCKYLRSINVGSKRIYEPGYMIWISQYQQSVQKKETYAYAFAKVLQDAGIKATAGSRLD